MTFYYLNALNQISPYIKKNILHVSDKEEIKVASLFLHFYPFKKITLK